MGVYATTAEVMGNASVHAKRNELEVCLLDASTEAWSFANPL